MKWDGEWHITIETFRDLGLAFTAVLVLIYVLMVGWFRSFLTPLVVMAAIPFSLVGILPAHGLLGAFFTATSMIGFMASAGIVIRNSIILVDFIEQRLREGVSLDAAVVDPGTVRFRPMFITAMAVIVGGAVILFDPIFQGLAISLMAGEIASLLISRMAVPVLYFMAHRRTCQDPMPVLRDQPIGIDPRKLFYLWCRPADNPGARRAGASHSAGAEGSGPPARSGSPQGEKQSNQANAATARLDPPNTLWYPF